MTTKDWSVIGMYTCSLFKPGTDGLNNKIMAPSHATFCVCRVIHVTKFFFVHLPSTLFWFFVFWSCRVNMSVLRTTIEGVVFHASVLL